MNSPPLSPFFFFADLSSFRFLSSDYKASFFSPLSWLLHCNWSWKPRDKQLSVRRADRRARWLLLSFNKWADLEEERRAEGRRGCSSCFFDCHILVVCWETCLLSHKYTHLHLSIHPFIFLCLSSILPLVKMLCIPERQTEGEKRKSPNN